MKRCKNKGIGDFSHSLIFAYSVRLCNMKMNILTQSVEELPIERESRVRRDRNRYKKIALFIQVAREESERSKLSECE